MNNSIANRLRFRTFLLRLVLLFGSVFSLSFLCGRLAIHIVARASQPQEARERIERKLPKPSVENEADPVKAEENRRKAEKAFRDENKRPPKPKPDTWGLAKPSTPSKNLGKITLKPALTTERIDQIHVPQGLRGLDLTAVHKINERFLLDVPKFGSGPDWSLALRDGVDPLHLKELFANTSVITAAKLADGTRVLTVIDMPGSFDADRLVGRMERLANTEQVRRIVAEQGRGGRVFFYGNDLPDIDLTSIANDTGVELVRRTNKTQDLVSVQQRLNTIARRGFDPEHAVVVNALPVSREAVESMGSFAGRAETWLDFRESIESVTPANIRTTSGKDDLFRELRQGDSDLLVLVAHSDGLHVYLNDNRVPLSEINALLDRQTHSERPRLAVLASCNAGKANSPSMWKRILRRDYAPLAHMLLEKGFVDKVIAPDHDIGPEEALEAVRKALAGQTQSILHWTEWAVRVRPLFGVPS